MKATNSQKERFKAYYRANREHLKEKSIKNSQMNAESRHRVSRASYDRLRTELLQAYGNQCVCCGEGEQAFLAIDHINGDVPELEKEGKKLHGDSFYRYLKRSNWPEGYQILCANCNTAVRFGRVCPHQEVGT